MVFWDPIEVEYLGLPPPRLKPGAPAAPAALRTAAPAPGADFMEMAAYYVCIYIKHICIHGYSIFKSSLGFRVWGLGFRETLKDTIAFITYLCVVLCVNACTSMYMYIIYTYKLPTPCPGIFFKVHDTMRNAYRCRILLVSGAPLQMKNLEPCA